VRIEGYGIGVDLPAGWEGRIFRLVEGWPTLHAANFALPPEDGEFGSLALSSMGPAGVFIALTEYTPRLAGRGLFGSQGLRLPLAGDFDSRALVRLRSGRFGVQRFFTAAERALCLYVGVGSVPSRAALVDTARPVLSTLEIGPATPASTEGQDSGAEATGASLRRL